MKKLLLSIAIVALFATANAQTVGVLVQPEFTTSNTMRGFYAQSNIIGRLGVYVNFKVRKEESKIHEIRVSQLNAGASLRLSGNVKVVAARSVSSREQFYYSERQRDQDQSGTRNLKPSNEFGLLYSASYFSVLGSYETGSDNPRITIGFGFNF